MWQLSAKAESISTSKGKLTGTDSTPPQALTHRSAKKPLLGVSPCTPPLFDSCAAVSRSSHVTISREDIEDDEKITSKALSKH